jgi:glycosyltransferase involved in cell wall biosynthesis
MPQKVLLAFGSVPKDGGTFTFYRNMREPLMAHGIDLRCVTVGLNEARLWEEAYADEGCVLLAENQSNIKKQAQAFHQWCEQTNVDIVMGVNSVAILSALPHLPCHIRLISRCANAFDHGYRITVSCYERLSRIIALAPRQIEDLIEHYGADRERIELIPNGTSSARFEVAAAQPRGECKEIRLGFLGRLEHTQKGVLHLPDILHRLKENKVKFTLSIAGKGVHEATLRQKLSGFEKSGVVQFMGALGPGDIAGFFANIDVYLFPSHFEGSPNSLIEAVMSGCVPAAWRLEGITDFLITDEDTGLLAETGDSRGLADKITYLASNREKLNVMSEAVLNNARSRFGLERVCDDYVKVIKTIMEEPFIPCTVKPWNQFEVESAFKQPRWRSFVPISLKRMIKKLFFKLGWVDRFE